MAKTPLLVPTPNERRVKEGSEKLWGVYKLYYPIRSKWDEGLRPSMRMTKPMELKKQIPLKEQWHGAWAKS